MTNAVTVLGEHVTDSRVAILAPEVADKFIKIAAYVVSDLDSPEARLRQREQDRYFEEEGLYF